MSPRFRIMFPLDVKHRWIFVANLAILFCVQNHVYAELDMCHHRKIMLINGTSIQEGCHFSSEPQTFGDVEVCFCFKQNERSPDCCPDYNITKHGNKKYIYMNENIQEDQYILLMLSPLQNFNCSPSTLCNQSGLLHLQSCLDRGIQSYKVEGCEEDQSYNQMCCKDNTEGICIIVDGTELKKCMTCKLPGKKPEMSITEPSDGDNSPENAVNVMNNLTSLLEKMGNSSSAAITIGNVKGLLTKLSSQDPTEIKIGIPSASAGNELILLGNSSDSDTRISQEIQIPAEAYAMAVKRNASFAAIFSFPGIHQDNSDSYLVNNEMLGIDMGVEICNLSHSIDILYRNVNKTGNVASCRSWSGTGRQTWITDGCETKELNDSITCQCSHLTFFALLMSPPPGNITAADYNALTYITSIGCGLSLFFLAVAIFMHFVIRKGRATQATTIMINLFVAMFTMNLSFLVNSDIADLDNSGACVTIAAVMHYTLLATFSWFFVEALHLFVNLWKLPSEIRHYMAKICIMGWVTPAIVVVILLGCKEYGLLVIHTNDGNSAKMCWITDRTVLQWVNIGYYAVVFVFTLSIFVLTVQRFMLLRRTTGKNQDNSNTKVNTFSILALFILLGITWAFAFFSHGPLLIPSYYIFTVLNSLQGFFLFIYYFNSSKMVVPSASSSSSSSSSSTIASETVMTSPYQ